MMSLNKAQFPGRETGYDKTESHTCRCAIWAAAALPTST